jgi:small-conductance mechanosensitive channel
MAIAALFSLLLGLSLSIPVQTAGSSEPPSTGQPPGPVASAPGSPQSDPVVVRVPKQDFAELRFSNRHIVTFRARVVPREPSDRAESAVRVLEQLADDNVRGPVAARPFLGAVVITVGGRDAFGIVAEDVGEGSQDLTGLTAEVIGRLQIAMAEAAEARTPARLARGAGFALVASVLLAAAIMALVRARRWAGGRLVAAASSRLARAGAGFDLTFLRASRLLDLAHGTVRLAAWGIGAVVVYMWLAFVLRQCPLTRPWGEALRGFLTERLVTLGVGALAALPGLFTAVLIFLAARFLTRLSSLLFTAVEQGRVNLFGLDPPKAAPTRRIVSALIWIFAIVVAYPYLPGSETEAFKGVSVFVGLVVSLGSSGIVNHLMSGFMLTYSGALTAGDYVRIGDVEGVVTGLGVLSTKVKTPRNDEVTIPNAVIVSGNTVNYTRYSRDGVYVSTSVTIGYDTPWRQVHAMLLTAASRTSGVRSDRTPSVLQSGLSDFYVEYTLLVCPADPRRRVYVLAELHTHIQDVFNEHGVQIMSPHYESDPSEAKVVPPERWHPAPALRDEGPRPGGHDAITRGGTSAV